MTAAPPRAAQQSGEVGAGDLSCLTAGLALYLTGRWPNPLARIAQSVRLAVRTDLADDLLAFSHHSLALCGLPDGRRLGYRGTSEVSELVRQLDDELAGEGDALIVTYSAAMPWSLAEPLTTAPHFVLLTEHRGERWRLRDPFTALLPAGRQDAYEGWVHTVDLVTAMMPPAPLGTEHRLRKQYAFGFALPVPDGTYHWLSPSRAATDQARDDRARWILDPLAALDFLKEFFADLGRRPDRARFVDDLWAAARHHTFRLRHVVQHYGVEPGERDVLSAAAAAWTDLPMALRFAVDSAARGRPRPSLVRATFDQLRRAQKRCADLLATFGHTTEEGNQP